MAPINSFTYEELVPLASPVHFRQILRVLFQLNSELIEQECMVTVEADQFPPDSRLIGTGHPHCTAGKKIAFLA